jgi:hypothetical protein
MRVAPSGPTPSIRLVTRRSLQFRLARCGTSGGSVAARRPPRPAGCPSAAQGRRRRPRWRPCPPGRPARVGCRSAARSTVPASRRRRTGRGRQRPHWRSPRPASAVSATAHRPARRLPTASRSGWLAAAASGPARPWQAERERQPCSPFQTKPLGMSRPAEPAANSQDNKLLVGLASFREAKRGGQVGVSLTKAVGCSARTHQATSNSRPMLVGVLGRACGLASPTSTLTADARTRAGP